MNKNTDPGFRKPLLFELKGNSLDDGPGIRTVVFFKGCPLDCVWCHNPESKRTGPELSYDPKRCIGCGHCMEVCPEGAIAKENRFSIDRARCTLCMTCIDGCPSGALRRVGFSMEVSEVLRTVMRDKPFFDNSGGGVTLSGGEPAMHMEYAAEIAAGLKAQGIHVLLETCGLYGHDRFSTLLLPHLDAVYFDIKLIREQDHVEHCGASNRIILENFRRLAAHALASGITLLPRTPLVPGITDTNANLEGLAAFIRECGIRKAELLPYNPLWPEKLWSLGYEAGEGPLQRVRSFMHRDHVEHCRAVYRTFGIET